MHLPVPYSPATQLPHKGSLRTFLVPRVPQEHPDCILETDILVLFLALPDSQSNPRHFAHVALASTFAHSWGIKVPIPRHTGNTTGPPMPTKVVSKLTSHLSL